MARASWVPLVLVVVVLLTGCAAWPQWGDGPSHSGFNASETSLSTSNVSDLRVLFTDSLPEAADGAPAFVPAVHTSTGTHDLLIAETKAATLVAVDAQSGAPVWSAKFGSTTCFINGGSTPCYTTSSPAVDANAKFVYAYGLDGKVHKVAVGTGTEVVNTSWPELTTRKAFDEKGSSALSVATATNGTSYLYVTHAGYPGDGGDYQGHVTTINLATGGQHVFNTLCSNQTVHFTEHANPDCPHVQSGVWARAGVVYDSTTNRVLLSSGNGDFNPSAHDWGDTVSALSPNGVGNAAGNPVDAYTPSNYATLQQTDTDLGSTAPAILPDTSGHGVDLGVQGGKDAQLRLLNLANLSGHNAPGFTGGELQTLPVPQGGEVLTTPAVWTNPADNSVWVFVANDNGTAALQLVWVNGLLPQLQTRWNIAQPGTTPVVANGVLYVAAGNFIGAYNAATGALLWHDTTISSLHWQSPIVNDGIVYIEDNAGHLRAYSR